jgi:hypothetical protein
MIGNEGTTEHPASTPVQRVVSHRAWRRVTAAAARALHYALNRGCCLPREQVNCAAL